MLTTLNEGVELMKRRAMALLLTMIVLASMFAIPVGASAASKKKVQILRVTEDGARVHSGPSAFYEVIGSLKKGQKVFYLDQIKNSFAYICNEKGYTGFVYKGFLERYGVVYKYQIYRSTKSKVGVYKKPSTKSGKVTKLSKNQHVIVYQVQGSWAYIKTLSGKGGYVKTSALTKAG